MKKSIWWDQDGLGVGTMTPVSAWFNGLITRKEFNDLVNKKEKNHDTTSSS